MRYVDKENSLLAGKRTGIYMVLFAFLLIALSGCKGEVEPPLSKPQPAAQTVPATEEALQVESDQYEEDADEAEESEGVTTGDSTAKRPPELVSLKLSPRVVYPGTKVKVLAEGRDKDDEDLTFYYRWQKNEVFLPGEDGDELDTSGFNKGDLITAFVTPFDGEVRGKERMSPSLLVSNRPPEITSAPIGNIVGGLFIYEVEANDPDGDELKFSLEGSPSGMTINAAGKVEWKVPTDAKGPFTIKVVVSDGDATTFQGFNIGEIVIELR